MLDISWTLFLKHLLINFLIYVNYFLTSFANTISSNTFCSFTKEDLFLDLDFRFLWKKKTSLLSSDEGIKFTTMIWNFEILSTYFYSMIMLQQTLS